MKKFLVLGALSLFCLGGDINAMGEVSPDPLHPVNIDAGLDIKDEITSPLRDYVSIWQEKDSDDPVCKKSDTTTGIETVQTTPWGVCEIHHTFDLLGYESEDVTDIISRVKKTDVQINELSSTQKKVRGVNIVNVNKEDVKTVLQWVKKQDDIEFISLYYCIITDDILEALGDAIKGKVKFKRLEIHIEDFLNLMTENAYVSFIEELSRCVGLRKFDFIVNDANDYPRRLLQSWNPFQNSLSATPEEKELSRNRLQKAIEEAREAIKSGRVECRKLLIALQTNLAELEEGTNDFTQEAREQLEQNLKKFTKDFLDLYEKIATKDSSKTKSFLRLYLEKAAAQYQTSSKRPSNLTPNSDIASFEAADGITSNNWEYWSHALRLIDPIDTGDIPRFDELILNEWVDILGEEVGGIHCVPTDYVLKHAVWRETQRSAN